MRTMAMAKHLKEIAGEVGSGGSDYQHDCGTEAELRQIMRWLYMSSRPALWASSLLSLANWPLPCTAMF